jgi:transposase-like protein
VPALHRPESLNPVAGRSRFSEEDKQRVFVHLASNDGNVKRTARELGMAPSTVRKWRDEWQKDGPPPAEELEEVVADFVNRAETVRFKALDVAEELIDARKVKLSELNVTVGVLSDKIDRAKGIDRPRGEEQNALLASDQVRELVVGFVQGMQQLAEAREAEIIEAELVVPKALPAAK